MAMHGLRTVWDVALINGTVLTICTVVVGGGYLWLRPPTVFDLPDARVSYKTGGAGGTVTFLVRDAKGRPIEDVRVNSESYSGWTSKDVRTDDAGRAAIWPGEEEVIAVEVDGRIVRFERKTRIENEFLPNCSGGLIFEVELRREDSE
jgi:hypothetical protein